MNKKYALFGFLSPLTAFVFIATAIHVHNFQFTGNALSDMGRIGLEKNYIFNSGLILSGIFALPFSLLLCNTLKKYEKVPGIIFIIAVLFLICIGVFPEGKNLHGFFSVGFYLLALISILFLGILLLKRKGNIGLFSIFGAVTALILALTPKWDGVAIPETIGAFFICLWMMVLAYELWGSKL
jgi:hypothetical membrane protein